MSDRRSQCAVLIGLFVNGVYWFPMWPEVRQRLSHQRATQRTWRDRVQEVLRGYP